jgi:hypothetical protein
MKQMVFVENCATVNDRPMFGDGVVMKMADAIAMKLADNTQGLTATKMAQRTFAGQVEQEEKNA